MSNPAFENWVKSASFSMTLSTHAIEAMSILWSHGNNSVYATTILSHSLTSLINKGLVKFIETKNGPCLIELTEPGILVAQLLVLSNSFNAVNLGRTTRRAA